MLRVADRSDVGDDNQINNVNLDQWNGRVDIVSPLHKDHEESFKNNFLSPISVTLIFRVTG